MRSMAASALLAVWLAAGPALAAGALDGKAFVAETGEKNKPVDAKKDEITFKDGKLHSLGCDAYGFGDGAYTAATKDGVTTFQAETTSAKEGSIKWAGSVKGEAIEATYTWTKSGQAPIAYWLKGTLKK